MKRDRSLVLVLGLFTLALIAAALIGGHHTGKIIDGLSDSSTQNAAEINKLKSTLANLHQTDAPMTSKDPRDPLWMGQDGMAPFIYLPARPLSALAVGQRDLLPQAMVVNTDAHLSEAREVETPLKGPTRLMTGAFDLAFLFVVLFPLVVIALSYELLSGERERGTLAMLLAQPISQLTLVLGKAAARALALCAVSLIFMFIGLALAGVDLASRETWFSMANLALVLVSWTFIWFAASVFINSFALASATNALILVGAWLVFVVIVPGLSQVAADVAYPPPSGVHLMHEAREATQVAKAQLDNMTGTHEKKEKDKNFSKRLIDVQEQLALKMKPILDEAHAEQAARRSMLRILSFASPAMLLQNALEDIAGSGVARHVDFDKQVDGFHARYRAHFVTMIKSAKRLTTSDIEAAPVFQYRAEDPGTRMARIGQSVMAMVLATLLLLGLSVARLRRIGRLTN